MCVSVCVCMRKCTRGADAELVDFFFFSVDPMDKSSMINQLMSVIAGDCRPPQMFLFLIFHLILLHCQRPVAYE